jgi:outer membrane protein
LKQAVVSAKTALQASQAGLNIGTRTTVDVLTARKNLLSARTNYAQSRYQYLVDGLLLEQAAGALTVKDIESINRYLTRKEPPPADKAKADTPPQAVGQTHSH